MSDIVIPAIQVNRNKRTGNHHKIMHYSNLINKRVSAMKLTFSPKFWLCLQATCWLFLFGSCSNQKTDQLVRGVSESLAHDRFRMIKDVAYDIHFSIPDSLSQSIEGRETISFQLQTTREPVVLDFNADSTMISAVMVKGNQVPYTFKNGHIVIPGDALQRGSNAVMIEFTAGESSLNRNEEFLYTLFVPDRASFAFPCFDQPDMKARFTLSLEIPEAWVAIANGSKAEEKIENGRRHYTFAETQKISTYLFSFVAGKFSVVTEERNGRSMTMLHRENDTEKVTRNAAEIFNLHASALKWLEEYTAIPYPFSTFDFALIPPFQYGGMEHPGAILYRASSLMLDKSATENQKLRRASLISHETAHMWFGDLVTMSWFNDVWMKEVFANFMAAKIVNPTFPHLDHDIRFLLSHYPSAYSVDRTAGANPIRQKLENLQKAGTLYGAIIYQKAPIVMKHLERLIGADLFREGIREYLKRFAFGNATWPDLISILDEKTADDLRLWSKIWVNEPGRPHISAAVKLTPDGYINEINISQRDPAGESRLWNQELNVLVAKDNKFGYLPTRLEDNETTIMATPGIEKPDFVLLNGKGIGYGHFSFDTESRKYVLENLHKIESDLVRAACLVTLWDEMLSSHISPPVLMTTLLRSIQTEDNILITQALLNYTKKLFWKYSTHEQRMGRVEKIENVLWEKVRISTTQKRKAAYYQTIKDIFLTESTTKRLYQVWRERQPVHGLNLSEADFISLALELAVREVENPDNILINQHDRMTSKDRKQRLKFIAPALSQEQKKRDAFFARLKDAQNRHHEPWVLSALRYLHHPLRARSAEKYIRPSLDLLDEIQRTGDIFFPKRWLDATLGGHNSTNAQSIVDTFLKQKPGYEPQLLRKIQQAEHELTRAAVILHGWKAE